MKILIVDNEKAIREGLRIMIEDSFLEVTAIAEANDIETAQRLIQKEAPELIFLDVELDNESGFDLADSFKDPHFSLVFITAHNKYAVEAFRFSAIDFLLKPIDADELKRAIERARENKLKKEMVAQLAILKESFRNPTQHDRKIVLKDQESIYFIKVNDIFYLEADGPYTRFFIRDSHPVLISRNLKEYEIMLEDQGFIRAHHSYLVNSNHVVKYDKADGGTLVLSDASRVSISQRKKEFVLQKLQLST
ncbi:MAG: LytR/AlgR family response regulator transcription factor [Flavobacteriales bacterium]